jgi:hypothetical protein
VEVFPRKLRAALRVCVSPLTRNAFELLFAARGAGVMFARVEKVIWEAFRVVRIWEVVVELLFAAGAGVRFARIVECLPVVRMQALVCRSCAGAPRAGVTLRTLRRFPLHLLQLALAAHLLLLNTRLRNPLQLLSLPSINGRPFLRGLLCRHRRSLGNRGKRRPQSAPVCWLVVCAFSAA